MTPNLFPENRSPNRNNDPKEPIAIIGIGCRFPGGADSPDKFWALLRNGVNAVSEIPSSRMDVEKYFDPRPATPGKMMTRWGGFLKDIDQFDASFFGIAPREADRLDPQQRLLLEVAWEAIEDSGYLPEQLKGSLTGVYTGLWLNDFEARLFNDPSQIDFYMTTGSGRYSASGRISYFLGVQGPSITVDTACSSSLVAIHLACQSLHSGETTVALAGGANVILQPHISIAYSQSKMMAPDGKCKFGDAQADGYVRSEGAAFVVLKRLSQAIQDGDSIYAVIRGSAVNNDGQTSGYLATPGQQGQEEMLRLAYQNAGIEPHRVLYVEAHGTGTRAGDPIELGAIGAVLGENRLSQTPLLVGSVKTNIGHTEGAAGIAGLIKVSLALKKGMIPPSLHIHELNPNIPWQELKLAIVKELSPWPASMEKIAGVSAFGIAGTNAHIVLAEAPPFSSKNHTDHTTDTYLLPLSAQTPEALRSLAESYVAFLNKKEPPRLADLCFTAGTRRTHLAERLTVTGKSHEELTEQLTTYLKHDSNPDQLKIEGHPKVAFVFPGQGAQWLGMGRQLLDQSRVFSEVLQQCDLNIRIWTDWSLLEQLTLDEDSPNYRLTEIGVIQPVLFAMEVALAAVWRAWGIEPSAVVGHSMGEVAAAYVAGVLSLDDAVRVICKRSQLMQRTSGQGAMAVIGLPYEETKRLLNGYEEKLSIAVQNSPKSTVLSGDPQVLELFMEKLQAQEIFCRLIKVDVASHSPQMDSIRPELVEGLRGIQPQAGGIPFYSTVTGDIHDGSSLDADYWGHNLRQPVRFSTTIERLLEDEHVVFIEMSPHPILLSSIEETRSQAERPAFGFASLRRDQPELMTMLGELGSLYMLGFPVDWNRLYPNGGTVVSLPTYPWQRERFWFETSDLQMPVRPGAHPLLGIYVHSASGEHIWETSIGIRQFPYLSDHQVRGSAVFPAAAFVEIALAAASEVYGPELCAVKDFSFLEALYLPVEETRILQFVMNDSAEFRIYSRAAQCRPGEEWALHATGGIKVTSDTPVKTDISAMEIPAGLPVGAAGEEFYQAASIRGLEYGPAFQAIMDIRPHRDGILAKIRLPEDLLAQAVKYQLHPVLIDAGFQTLLAALPGSNQDTYLPTRLESLQVHGKPDFSGEFWAYAMPNIKSAEVTGDILLFDKDGHMVLSATGLRMQRLEAKTEDIRDFLYEIAWQESPIVLKNRSASKHWLIFSDQQGVGRSLANKLQRDSHECTLVFAGSSYRSIDEISCEIDARQPEHFQKLVQEINGPIHGIVYLWNLDSATVPSIQDLNLGGVLYLTQAAAQMNVEELPRLWLVTRGTQTVHAELEPVSVSQSSVWGMGAVIANELPALHFTCVDLSPIPLADELELLSQVLLAGDHEDQVALRNGQRYAARLKRSQVPAENEAENVVRRKIEADQPFRVQNSTPGILEGLSLAPVLRRSPKAGEVEIAVKAAGLNFMNVMGAMGIYPGYPDGIGPLGIECAGIIVRVGEDVTDFQPGDEVVGIAFDSLASHAVTDACLIVNKPSRMTFEVAATLPIAYVTAYYALHDLGRLLPGERVLIHAATGGVGLAAIQLAKRAGAEIFATAGSPEKREFLRNLGIKHIYDSRTLAFAEEILEQTDGEGVDLVLNSLAGNAIMKGLEILKPFGRFMEIGKRDIYQNSKLGLLPFQKNLSYFAIALDKMSRERPEVMGGILCEIFRLLETREIAPLPLQSYLVSKVSDAFRTMAQAKHIGKIAITMEDPDAALEIPAGAIPVRGDGTYLITGGLGDLGLTFARWLAIQGARHLVLMGRRKPSQEAQSVIDDLRDADVNIRTVQADVTDTNLLAEALSYIKENQPPLRGIIHAAGVLADGTILQMDWEQFSRAWAPKALGAWNLHALTVDQPLDFFILFSSVASLLGTPGQINYAAGNAVMDALARYRKGQNLPALSINWGPWSGIGLASAQTNRGDRLTQQGLLSISPEQGLDAMPVVIANGKSQMSVVRLDSGKWCSAQAAAARSSLFKEFSLQALADKLHKHSPARNIRDDVLAVEPGRQRRLLLDKYIREQIAHVLHLSPARIQSDKPLKTLGLDSLMSIELRNRLEDGLSMSLPASLIWNYPSVNALVPFLAERMGIPLDEQKKPAADNMLEANSETQHLDDLTKDELEALLAEELSAIDDSQKGKGFGTESGTG